MKFYETNLSSLQRVGRLQRRGKLGLSRTKTTWLWKKKIWKVENKFGSSDYCTTFILLMEITTTKVTKETLKNAKEISGKTGEKQYMVIHNAVKEKKETLKKKRSKK